MPNANQQKAAISISVFIENNFLNQNISNQNISKRTTNVTGFADVPAFGFLSALVSQRMLFKEQMLIDGLQAGLLEIHLLVP